MRSLPALAALPALCVCAHRLAAQTNFCTPQANVAIYSNYDGGLLLINVDQNIPNLHIGVVSYEFSRITVTGPFAANVVALWYVGYDADNNHCALPLPHTTSISGAPAGTDSIVIYPPATYANGNGWPSILCNYSCDVNTNQGGCNTADQIAHWFLTQWGGSLLFHFTQYGCWGNGYSISGGGNCCENPLATAVQGSVGSHAPVILEVITDGNILSVDALGPVQVVDVFGHVVLEDRTGSGRRTIDIRALATGKYVVSDPLTGRVGRLVVQR